MKQESAEFKALESEFYIIKEEEKEHEKDDEKIV